MRIRVFLEENAEVRHCVVQDARPAAPEIVRGHDVTSMPDDVTAVSLKDVVNNL